MKTGLDIQELAVELERQNESKQDFLADTSKVSAVPVSRDSGPFALAFKVDGKKNRQEFQMNRFMLNQVAQHTKVPMPLVDILYSGTPREREELGQLLSVRLQENPVVRMIRTMIDREGNPFARAFLSEKYRRLDNYDLAGAVFPILSEFDDIKVMSSEVTDERMFIKVVVPEMAFNIGSATDRKGKKIGDIIEAGVSISNSEVGSGSLRVEPFIYRLVCLNGMISNDHSLRKNHVGRSNGNDFESATELFSQETLSLDDAAFYGKVTDTVRATLQDEDKFLKIATRIMDAKGEPITGDAQASVVELGRKFTLTESTTQSILTHLIKGGDLSKFGLANAVTAFARDDKNKMSYMEATDFEYLGGQIIDLGKADWKIISEAAIEEAGAKRRRNAKNN